ncbi:phosphonate ABC transporter ATP-binding protein [Paenibacillus tarimensis]|uniref:phosphonate ABC transporter ATP-binding protein n=1 Tax=Paenibacillus tarimensis TaxID=416012 RepID=UPI001F477D23|nr:phosphonate ABC transporter ATP-binding protein [Paenibacillus tarimensis]MCF2942864.1 phosphonate ABC transporter ATP-binding protein [Paenibacillus tarimensis]
MLEITGLTKQYSGEKEPALQNISLTVREGEFVAVLGRSGAGKSTMIRCINRLVEPDTGSIVWKGRSITGMNTRELRSLRREIGFVFQHFNLLPRLSVLTNVIAGRFGMMPSWRSVTGQFTEADRKLALEALEEVGLGSLAAKRVEDLSGGQRQRVAIARVLMQQPSLLLGDEPISSLDPVTSERIMRYIGGLHRERGMTILLNLHDVNSAKAFATRIIGLSGGRIVFDGPPQQLGDQELLQIYPLD